MDIKLFQQQPSSAGSETLKATIISRLSAGEYTHVRVAVAYATVSGVRALINAFPADSLKNSHWLVGLDDAITQPGAIELLLNLTNAKVRVAEYAPKSLRFHPKVFSFVSSAKQMMIVGSANLTQNALSGNAEAASILDAVNADDKNQLNSFWDKIWRQGREISNDELLAYKSRYNLFRRHNIKTQKLLRAKKVEILASDGAELDPAIADVCWIECGFITAMGRELEFKAEQGLFFGLSPTGGNTKTFKFITSSKSVVSLKMKYQQNHMWRLQMTNEVPEVQAQLRPLLPNGKLGRSPYVAVFKRTNDKKIFKISFVTLQSKDFKELLKQSKKQGTVGKTSARSYGWC